MGRPREGRVDEAIATATRELLAEAGYAGLTMDAVAARARIGKAAIYRRYASKQELVFAATIHGQVVPIPADSGSLLGDLTALAQQIVESVGNPIASNVALRLLADVSPDPALAKRASAAILQPQRAVIAELLERAVRRGELDHRPDIDLLHAALNGTTLSWLFIAHRSPHDLPERLARIACTALQSQPHQPPGTNPHQAP